MIQYAVFHIFKIMNRVHRNRVAMMHKTHAINELKIPVSISLTRNAVLSVTGSQSVKFQITMVTFTI